MCRVSKYFYVTVDRILKSSCEIPKQTRTREKVKLWSCITQTTTFRNKKGNFTKWFNMSTKKCHQTIAKCNPNPNIL